MSSRDRELDPLLGRREIPLAGDRNATAAAAAGDSSSETLVNFDQVLDHVGAFGPWQMLMIGLLWFPPMSGGLIVLLWSFAGLEPEAFRYLSSKVLQQLHFGNARQ